MSYAYDPDIREAVAEFLYAHLPELYRVRDLPQAVPVGRVKPLESFVGLMASPLAVLRQNIEELHSDLFIDSADDWVLPFLAEMVGTSLVFPDAISNRRDIRRTVYWRRRKGTPSTLEELAGTLSDDLVVTHEGWQRVLMAQDLNLLHESRLARTIPNIRSLLLAETADGPLDREYHVIDARTPITDRHGRYHPAHVYHWRHLTEFYPQRHATPTRFPDGDHDFRFAFDPLRAAADDPQALRVRPADITDLATDRVLPRHFEAEPQRYFGVTGGFTVHICGVTAAVAAPSAVLRVASDLLAHRTLVDSRVSVTVLDHNPRGQTGVVDVEVLAVRPQQADPGMPDPPTAKLRGGVTLEATGASEPLSNTSAAAVANPIAMLRLSVAAARGWFPGAVVEIAVTSDPAALHAHPKPVLAEEGFLRGALIVAVPAGWVDGNSWYYIAADGSLYPAQSAPGGPVDVALTGPETERVIPRAPVTTGPGAAWPPVAIAAGKADIAGIPVAAGRGPAMMHGGRVVKDSTSTDVGATDAAALIFAVKARIAGSDVVEPMVRLGWEGPQPDAPKWEVLGAGGAPAGDPQGRLAQLSAIARTYETWLLARFEAADDTALLPCEVVWTDETGHPTLLYLPELVTEANNPEPALPVTGGAASEAVALGADGASKWEKTGNVARYSLGQVAPLRGRMTVIRRSIRRRRLCSWANETAALKTPRTPPRFIDIDPEYGLFSLAKSDGIQAFADPSNGRPIVTVNHQLGYSDHCGALPAPREPELNMRLDQPTRVVAAGGAFHSAAPAQRHATPRYDSLMAALADIVSAAAIGLANEHEVVQIEDSATYAGEAPVWPDHPDGPRRLTIQAAENTRPTVVLNSWTDAGARYDRIEMIGLAFGGADVSFPVTEHIALRYCTVTDASSTLRFASTGEQADVDIGHCVIGPVHLKGGVTLAVNDSVIDATAAGDALRAEAGSATLDRVTVRGDVRVLRIDASECIFDGGLHALDQFSGCLRFSYVPDYSEPPTTNQLPRVHRVVEHRAARLDFVSTDRNHPAHMRLSDRTGRAIRRGAEDGSEMGAFHSRRFAERAEALQTRLSEYTPAGLVSGIIDRH